MKKLLLFVSVLALTLTGCEDNETPNTVLTSEIKVDGVSFNPTRNGLNTYFVEGNSEVADRRFFTLIKGSGENISQAIYVNLDLWDGRSNEGGSYIFHIGEVGTNLFANGMYLEGDVSYQLAGGTVHVTQMTDGYYKLVFENVQAVNVFSQTQQEKLITGEFKAKFNVINVPVE